MQSIGKRLFISATRRAPSAAFSTATPAAADASQPQKEATDPDAASGNKLNDRSTSGGGTGSSPVTRIPVRHSRKRLPTACTDPSELSERTQELIESPEGSLFTYIPGKDSRKDAWIRADETVQLAEYLVRGHNYHIANSTFHRWVSRGECVPAQEPETGIKGITSILDRLWDEGYSYMTLRASRLQEVSSRENISDLELQVDENLGLNKEEPDQYEEIFSATENRNGIEETSLVPLESQSSTRDYTLDFTAPGPTVHMYNLLFDSMACSNIAQPRDCQFYLDCLLLRHELDGGDEKNRNESTFMDTMSLNACIRVAASVAGRDNNIQDRDDAIALAFAAFDVLNQSTLLELNSATYEYLLQVIAKTFPPSRSRGNIAHGLLEHARDDGLWNTKVLEAYVASNEPSNGDEFDRYIERFIKGMRMKDIPEKFRKNSYVRRYHPREAIY